jgi:DNA (cytosine-5)-methyltransferase 1
MRAIDFFCGTGGFSRGAHDAGFDVVAAFDIDPILTSSFKKNFPSTKLFLKDIAQLTGESILADIGGGEIDLIFGGPPCQGFSSMGKRQISDPRRTLLRHFFRLVSELQPAVFVMENVQGLAFKEAKPELDAAIALVPKHYTILDPMILDASDFGAATKRKRMFVIGYDPQRCAAIDLDSINSAKSTVTTVAEALSGLSTAQKVKSDNADADEWKIAKDVVLSSYAKSLISDDRKFTGNLLTVHSDAIIDRFEALAPGKVDKIGRHYRLEWTGQCPTLRAGTGPDKGSHQAVRPVHPDENRVITVREAARLQGFPDYHLFHPTIWHSFRMIGNSVSPIIAHKILEVLKLKIGTRMNSDRMVA